MLAGTYDVEMIAAAPTNDAGSTFRISAGGQEVEGAVPATSDWETFTACAVGAITIATAGPCDVELKPIRMKGAGVMNLRAVVLTWR